MFACLPVLFFGVYLRRDCVTLSGSGGIQNMLSVLTREQLYTVDEFEELLKLPENAGRLLELIDGEIVEKMPTEEHGSIASAINYALMDYARKRRQGIVGNEVRYRVVKDKKNSRMPDVSLTLKNRPIVRSGAVPELPDLAVEIKSPDDSLKEMRENAEYYLANGTQIVWLVYPHQRCVEVYTLDTIELLCADDVLTGGDLLPDFSLSVAEIFLAPWETPSQSAT